MWTKAGRFMEDIHIVGDIFAKISANCMINLHAALLFTCLFLWVIIYAVITVFIFMGISCICCMYMLLLFQCEYVYLQMYLYVYILYRMLPQEFSVYNLIACSSKNLCGIAQLDVGYVILCSAKREQ
jgi:hypothetical protein